MAEGKISELEDISIESFKTEKQRYGLYIHNGILLGMRNNEIMPFETTWMELKGIMLSEISQRKTCIICFHSYVELERNLTEGHGGREGEKWFQTEREANPKRLLNTRTD